ncbi:TPA: leucotoxin LukD, partial [Staphylococcus aureus]|nr:leucotoxin LukD [Staphylococcus aureus]
MDMKKIVKSSVVTSIALLLLSNTVDAAQHITPVSEKK